MTAAAAAAVVAATVAVAHPRLIMSAPRLLTLTLTVCPKQRWYTRSHVVHVVAVRRHRKGFARTMGRTPVAAKP